MTGTQNLKAERRMISDSLSFAFLRNYSCCGYVGSFLFFPLVNVPDDSMIPRPFLYHSPDTALSRLIIYMEVRYHCDTLVMFYGLLSGFQLPPYQ